MNKAQLIEALSQSTGLSKNQTAKHIDILLNILTETLMKGNKIQLVGFGSFSTATRAARIGLSPVDGKVINLPAKKVVKFKPAKALSEAVEK